MASVQPYKGANTAQFYTLETTPGTTPSNPVWYPLRNTGGIPAVTRDALVSNELDGSRETTSIRTGNKQVTGEYAIELSNESQDELLAGAMTSEWIPGDILAAISVAVNDADKTYTRSDGGSFIADGVEVGSLVQFNHAFGNNHMPFIVTAVTDTVITGAGIQHTLVTANNPGVQLGIADRLETGNLCKSYSILTWMKGKCGSPDAYVVTRGVEFTGFTIEQAVNAMVTGSFPFIGMNQQVLTSVPTGSTFPIEFGAAPFASVDVSAYDGTAPLKLIDTFTITNDNGASAQYELGNSGVAFIERGKASNTFSLAGKLYDMTLWDKFNTETQVNLTSILYGEGGTMSFTVARAELTACTPEIGGPESITLTMEGQATGNAFQSSIVIQRLKELPQLVTTEEP